MGWKLSTVGAEEGYALPNGESSLAGIEEVVALSHLWGSQWKFTRSFTRVGA